VSVLTESSIEFDFTQAISVIEHDRPAPGHGNSTWPGVDFCITEQGGWIWLEVKNWDPTYIAPNRRGGSRWSFVSKMRSKSFSRDMRNKFLGTTAFLAWRGLFAPVSMQLVLLFQPPQPLDTALLVTLQTRMSSLVPNLSVWTHPIYVSVLDLTEWNLRYRQYPARLI
jgi:hypothetical protein